MRKLALLAASFSLCALAQVTADGITTSASKTVTLWPDNAVFTVDVTSAAGTTVDQAVAWLKDTGITAANLVGAGTTQESQFTPGGTPPARMLHEFRITVFYPRIKELSDKLRAATAVVAAAEGSLAYSLSLTASDYAVQLARQRVLPDLIAEVKRRADSLAGASGLMVGTIQAISDSSSVAPAPRWISTPVLIGSNTRGDGLQATFSVSAKFSVLK